MNTFSPTIGQPTDPTDNTAAAPSGTRVSFMPATGAGGIYNGDEDSLVVHGNPDSMSLTAASHNMTGGVDITQEAKRLAASVAAFEERLKDMKPGAERTVVEHQLQRAQERAAFGLNRLAQIAASRAK